MMSMKLGPEWDEAGEEFINVEQHGNVHDEQETTGKDIDVYFVANNATDTNASLDEGAGVDVGNMETKIGNDKMDVDKTKNHKGERVFLKKKFEERNNKQGGKGAGKGVAGKRKKEAICEKRKRKQVVGENGNIRDKNASDEVNKSTDDDFVANVGAKHGLGMDKEKGEGRKKWMMVMLNRRWFLKQKHDVRDIGFGDFLDFKIKDVPKRLAYWLLDKFDADTCSLNVNNRTIMITSTVVRNLLRVPMGELHINARDLTDFRTLLARKWKA
ncbi:hypothetical protein Tco_1348675 [Tanacetum coccineum]